MSRSGSKAAQQFELDQTTAKNNIVATAAVRKEIQMTVATACLLRLHFLAPRYSSLTTCLINQYWKGCKRRPRESSFAFHQATRREEAWCRSAFDNRSTNRILRRAVKPGIVGQVGCAQSRITGALRCMAGSAHRREQGHRSHRSLIGLHKIPLRLCTYRTMLSIFSSLPSAAAHDAISPLRPCVMVVIMASSELPQSQSSSARFG